MSEEEQLLPAFTEVTVREIVNFCTTSALLQVPGIIFHLSAVTVAGYSISPITKKSMSTNQRLFFLEPE
jgi:hypothetical protein